jgi:hypothetical protein
VDEKITGGFFGAAAHANIFLENIITTVGKR